MKYIISFQGLSSEVLMGEVPEKMFEYFRDRNLNVTNYMRGASEDQISDDISDGACFDTRDECDNLYHDCGPYLDDSVTMFVNKVSLERESDPHSTAVGEEVYSCRLDCECEAPDFPNTEHRTLAWLTNFDSEYVMVGEIYSRGYLVEYILELNDAEQFFPEKLTLLLDCIDEMYEIVTGLRYDGKDLECTGELDTFGNGERWYIVKTKTRETTITD
jgi:hypothetical protein